MANNNIVLTKAALALQQNNKYEPDFQVVTFKAHVKKPKKKVITEIQENDNNTQNINERKGIDLQRARREIIKFGISGFDAKKQEDINQAHAISLGAKPPKGQNKNYKELKREKILQKQLELQKTADRETGSSGSATMKQLKKNIDSQKKKSGILKIYGKPTIDTKTTNKVIEKKKVHKKTKR